MLGHTLMLGHTTGAIKLRPWLIVAGTCGLLVSLPASLALANGAAWKWPLPPGTPGPVRQPGLLLEKEEVLFRDGKGFATFWVRNETDRLIDTPMGFPLAVSLTHAERLRDPEGRARTAPEDVQPARVEALRRSIAVEVEGKRVATRLSYHEGGDYELVVGWRMTYPARAKTKFAVTFPLRLAWESSGGTPPLPNTCTHIAFKYITHTGAYWGKPIGEATFRFCDARMMQLHREMPDGREWTHDGWTYGDIKWTIRPAPFTVDRAGGCIAWQRASWTPVRDKDDLVVMVEATSAGPGGVDLPEEDRLLDRWCARYRVDYGEAADWPRFAHRRHFRKAAQHLAVEQRVDRRPLDDALLAQIEQKAWDRLRQNKNTLALASAPPHYRAMVRLRLLAYLRGYFDAIRGHVFEDQRLSACYAARGRRRRGSLTALERQNVLFLRQQEEKTALELKGALPALRRAPPGQRGDLRDWAHWPSLATW
jgi:hypothetical protein